MAKLAFLSSSAPEALKAKAFLESLHDSVEPDSADILIVLGGDGFMLEVMHKYLETKIPLYGIHCGSVGFLLNQFSPHDFLERLEKAVPTRLYPLEMQVHNKEDVITKALAFNEVSLLRESRQAAKIEISVDGVVRLPELICDGVLVSTPAGSTAYNLSAHGPIIPLETAVLALTSISAFRPRRWRGALLPEIAEVTFTIREPEKRPVSAVADFTEVRDVLSVTVRQLKKYGVTLLFDHDHNLEERILNEQFSMY